MGTSGSYDPPSAGASQDFFRSNAGVDLPNGTNDVTEDISRTGKTAIGNVPSNTPLAMLDVANGGRSGTDQRNAGDGAFVTATSDALGFGNVDAGRNSPTVDIIKAMHTNQSQGIGITYNGIHQIAGNNNDLFYQQRGSGQHTYLKTGASHLAIMNRWLATDALLPHPSVGHGFQQRDWQGNNELSNYYSSFVETANPDPISTRQQWNIRARSGALTPAMRLRPSHASNPGNGFTELYVGENQVHNRKLVLYDAVDNTDTAFYGIGVNANMLRYQAGAVAASHAFFLDTTEAVRVDQSGVIIQPAVAPPISGATDEILTRNPTTGRVGRTAARAKRVAALTGVTDANGNVTFNFAPAFAAAPICTITCESANANLVDARITARSASSVTVNVQQALAVTVLSISVLAAKVAAAGVTVHLHATENGQGA